jgi:hypothetical protein
LDGPAEDPRDESIGDLFGRLVDDGRAYAKAELGLYREIALHRAGRARAGLIALIAGAVLLLSSLTALILGLVLGLATLIGPLLAGIAIAAALALGGYLLVRSGIAGLGALRGGADEAEALHRGENGP